MPVVINSKLQRKIAAERARARKTNALRQPQNLTSLYGAPTSAKPQSVREIRNSLRAYVGVNTDTQFRKYMRQNKLANTEEAYAQIAARRFKDVIQQNTDRVKQEKLAVTKRKVSNSLKQKILSVETKQRFTEVIKYLKYMKLPVATDLGEAKRLLRDNAGKFVRISAKNKDGRVFMSAEVEIPSNISANWWHDFSRDYLFVESNITIWDANPDSTFTVNPELSDTFDVAKQYFLDGKVNHCLLTPIKNWIADKIAEVESRGVGKKSSTLSTYIALKKKCDQFLIDYAAGVPEEDVQKIANELRVDITIDTPFSSTPLITAESQKKKYRNFQFINTRLNHVDASTQQFNTIAFIDSNPTPASQETIDETFKQLTDNKEFCVYTKNMTGEKIKSITSINGCLRVHDAFREAVKEFEESTGINHCKIDDIKHNELSGYVQSSCGYNGCIDFWNLSGLFRNGSPVSKDNMALLTAKLEKNNQTLNHIDMSKAYANFHLCQYYKGFLGKITDFRATDKIEAVGIYTIANLVIPEGKIRDLNDKLHIYGSMQTYPSPELEMLRANGCTFDILGGCWGVKEIDFRFPGEMMEDKRYAKWVGSCNSVHDTRRFYMYGNHEYFNVLRKHMEPGNRIAKFIKGDAFNEALITTPKRSIRHLTHITSFILSYMRMNVLEQLAEFDLANVIRVHTDGIYYVGTPVPLKNCFREKDESMNFQTPANENGYYSSKHCDEDYGNVEDCGDMLPKWGPMRPHHVTELHSGPGGGGKTHFNLTDAGLFRCLYVAPSYKLARAKKNEYGVNTTVWAQCDSTDPAKTNRINAMANVLIVDEVSMMTDGGKQSLINTYPNHKIIFCGDIGYQLPPINKSDVFTHTGIAHVQQHNTVYRTECPELLELLNTLRKMITNEMSVSTINNFVRDRLASRTVTINELETKYQLEDMILAGTNENKQVYTDMFTGKFITEKYYIEENCKKYCNGDIIISNTKPDAKCAPRHAFTVHSIQGETLKAGKLFIDMSHMFDPTHAYTALSRAKRIDQVHLVINTREVSYTFPHAKIYVIETKTATYIGSTVNSLETRFGQHTSSANNYYTNNHGKFCTSFPLIKDGGKIRLLEKCPCDSISDLQKREAEIIKTHPSCVNKTFSDGHDPIQKKKRQMVKSKEAKLKAYEDNWEAENDAREAEDTKYNTCANCEACLRNIKDENDNSCNAIIFEQISQHLPYTATNIRLVCTDCHDERQLCSRPLFV